MEVPCIYAKWLLTIRSSGPLRRVAVLSGRGQQRPLNSSVRRHGNALSLLKRSQESCNGIASTFLNATESPLVAFVEQLFRCRVKLSLVMGWPWSALTERMRSLLLRRYGGVYGPPAALRRDWSLPGRSACCKQTLVAPVVRIAAAVAPNYSFKRTAATGCGNIMPRSAAAA